MPSSNKLTTDQSEVITIGGRIAEIQRRKVQVNSKTSTLRTELAALEQETRDLATEHQLLLRRFDSVSSLP